MIYAFENIKFGFHAENGSQEDSTDREVREASITGFRVRRRVALVSAAGNRGESKKWTD